MVNEKNKPEKELPHITLDPIDDIKTRKVGRGFGGFDSKPIDQNQFQNMLGKVISVGSVISDRFKNTYFLIDLTTEYFSPSVSSMLKDLKLEIKTILSETQIIVKGDKETLEVFQEKKNIPKKITNPIKRLYLLESSEKVGTELHELMKKDVDGTKVFSVSIRMLDNLADEEKQELKRILNEELKKEINPQYLEKSNQYICGSSSKRILEIAKIPFVKTISKIPKIQSQQSNNDEIFCKKGEYSIEENENAPKICVIDSGVSKDLEKYCDKIDQYIFSNSEDTVGHGTKVSSVALFGEDLIRKSKTLKQKSKLISFKIDDISSTDMLLDEAIMNAIDTYSKFTKVFCLSYTLLDSVDPQVRLDIVKKLDLYLQEKNVVLVISGGNINLHDAYTRKGDYPKYLVSYPVLSPSEAKNVFAVGAVCKKSTPQDCIISVISRMGLNPIFQRHDLDKWRFFKPDIYTYGGNSELKLKGKEIAVSPDLEIPVINLKGDLEYALGTSYSAPLVALCFARLYQKYNHTNSETYKAIMLNKSHYAEINDLPVFYVIDTRNVNDCRDGIYLNFEGEVTPKVRAEDIQPVNLLECKTVDFYMPDEAESIDIFTVHSNNYIFQDLRKYNTRFVVEIIKSNGVTIKKQYGTISRNCANTYAHYGFSRNYEGMWHIKVHVETRGIPAEMLKNLKVRFGVSIRINLKKDFEDNLREVHEKVVANTQKKEVGRAAKTEEKTADSIVHTTPEQAKGVA